MRNYLTIMVVVLACCWPSAAYAADSVSYDRQIRPILSNSCFKCHGPDPASRKADLRLDLAESATADKDGTAAIRPGDPDQSELLRRITSTDPDTRMPPPEAGDALPAEQVALIREWILQGAKYATHWAFIPPQQPAVPVADSGNWARNPIDQFILDRLNKEGLAPAPEADRLTLLRRLSLDLTGLPPTLEEMEHVQNDTSAQWYENSVERLLASPHYGERWARHWLDAAQYADSDGFEKDKPRFVWAWRDWVIRAFNDDMPYDQFIVEQVAGDLLPNAAPDQVVATGFLRNSMINEEGGIDPEQFRMEAMFNRMDIIGRAVLGLTVQCAQCHSHKYDPLTQTDYFRMFAFLNNTSEACETVYSPLEQKQRETLETLISEVEENLRSKHPDWRERMAEWEPTVKALPEPTWETLQFEFDDTSAGGQKCIQQDDGSYLAQGYAPTQFQPKMTAKTSLSRITAVRLELLIDPNLPRRGPGRSIYGTFALSEFELRAAPAGTPIEEFDKWTPVKLASAMADVNPAEHRLGQAFADKKDRQRITGSIDLAIDGKAETAWTNDVDPIRRNESCYAIFKLEQPLVLEPGTMLALRLSQQHGGWNSDDNQTNNLGRFRVSVTGDENLPDRAVPDRIKKIVAQPRLIEGAVEHELFSYWRTTVPEFASYNNRIDALWQAMPVGTTQLVLRERQVPRLTHRLDRGDFLSPKEPVTPGTPQFLHALSVPQAPSRLDFARWLVSRNSPTTARAFVNRVWQHYFGTGLVATSSDLGTQGEPPSHPELLDWLAVEFMNAGWKIKPLHRIIVTSATYRQSSVVTAEKLEHDPYNRLFARGARFRVEGEIVRDIALSASGLLNPIVGGPSVYPPAPEFLFQPPASYGPKTWRTEQGAGQYRRAMYTFRFRSVPHPALQAFDTPAGDAPCTRRNRSNTPLQALTTLNEPLFVDCARGLAAETLSKGGQSDPDRITFGFRRCLTREPLPEEVATLERFLSKQRTRIAAGELSAAEILGPDLAAKDVDKNELAAWTLLARVLLNLDETITRQ